MVARTIRACEYGSPMADVSPLFDDIPASRRELMFPVLTPAQIARMAAHGVVRRVTAGEVLIEQGAKVVPLFVVRSGQIEIVRPLQTGVTSVVTHGPGQFTGEMNLLSGRRAITRARAIEAGEVIELTRE